MWRLGEIAVELRWQMAVGAMMAAAFAVLARRTRTALVAGLLAVVHLAPAPLSTCRGPAGGEPDVRVMTANVLSTNPSPDRLVAEARLAEPNLLGVIELSHAWATTLPAALPELPHAVLEPRGSNFGLALLSRWPIVAHEVREAANHPWLHARVAAPTGVIDVWVVHPMPPGSPSMIEERQRYLEAVAADVAARGGERVIVLGDLNATLYSARLRTFLSRAGVQQTYVGCRRTPTWPTPVRGIGLDLDHVLVRGFDVVSRSVGGAIGGDHAPLVVALRIASGSTR